MMHPKAPESLHQIKLNFLNQQYADDSHVYISADVVEAFNVKALLCTNSFVHPHSLLTRNQDESGYVTSKCCSKASPT